MQFKRHSTESGTGLPTSIKGSERGQKCFLVKVTANGCDFFVPKAKHSSGSQASSCLVDIKSANHKAAPMAMYLLVKTRCNKATYKNNSDLYVSQHFEWER